MQVLLSLPTVNPVDSQVGMTANMLSQPERRMRLGSGTREDLGGYPAP